MIEHPIGCHDIMWAQHSCGQLATHHNIAVVFTVTEDDVGDDLAHTNTTQ